MYSRFMASFATHAINKFSMDSSLPCSQCNSLKAEQGTSTGVLSVFLIKKFVLIQPKHESSIVCQIQAVIQKHL